VNNQKPEQIEGDRERYVSGAGATPVLRTSRVSFAALVAPAPGKPPIQKIVGADRKYVWPESDRIDSALVADPHRIRNRYARDHKFIDRRYYMSKLKLEHGVSRIRRAKLQSSIDQTVADDIELLAQWSNNETNFVVNELLRFALTQDEDFQKYKAGSVANAARSASSAKTSTTPTKAVSESAAKTDASAAHA
jgi:hypothetical protein